MEHKRPANEVNADAAQFTSIFPGRHTAMMEGEFVVLLIGMRINRPAKLHRWLPVMREMAKMIDELERDPDSGLLGSQRGLFAVVQYWRSFEDLQRYARDPGGRHLPAWRAFNQHIRGTGDVGIWHEAYRVRSGQYEAIYGDMPRIGLASAGGHAPLGSTSTAATRMGAAA
jgi:hypothetical protein